MEENVIQINGGIEINVDLRWKTSYKLEESCENGKHLESIMDDSAIICDEIRESYDEETKTDPKIFNKKKAIYKTQKSYILLVFLLITIVLLIAVSIYCYLIKYQAMRKNLSQICHK